MHRKYFSILILLCLVIHYQIRKYHPPESEPFDKSTIERMIKDHPIISFDIFDTLLVRPYGHPADLWKHLEWLEGADGFFEARIKAVSEAVKNANGEITLDEVYMQIQPEFKHFREKELRLEAEILKANEEMQEIYNYALSQGKRIILVSDMYLPRIFLEEVLNKNGYTGFSKLYLSSEYREMKATGLFRTVLLNEHVLPGSILHIGDNVEADINGAKRYDIDTVFYPSRLEQLFERNKRAKLFYQNHSDSLSASIMLGMLACAPSQNTYWQQFGVTYAGPVILGFAHWINRKLKEDGIKEVMFVARDGYTVQKVFDLIRTVDVQTHYFYAPRKNSIIINFDYEYHHQMGTTLILDYYRRRTDYLKENTPPSNSIEMGIQFLKEHRDLYSQLLETDKHNYRQYLQQFHLKNKTIVVVDGISASASAQRALITVLPDHSVYAYYFYKREGYSSSGLHFDSYHKNSTQNISNYLIWEFIMTAPSPAANRIENGAVVFNNITSEEATIIRLYPEICRGAEVYAQQSHEIFGSIDYPLSDDIIIDWINSLCENPTVEDKVAFSNIKIGWHLEHLAYEHVMYNWY